MNQQDITKIKKDLLNELHRLEEEAGSMGHKSADGRKTEPYYVELGNKDDENAAEVALFSDNLSLEESVERQLRDVNDSLQRIESGTYGICKYCSKPIDINRLKARPTSSSCVQCKEKLSKTGA